MSARSVEIAAWVISVPFQRLSQNATKTSLGAGSRRLDSSPLCDAISQTTTRPSGSAQGASVPSAAASGGAERSDGHGHEADAAGRISLAIVSPNGPVLTASAARVGACASGSSGKTSSAKR